MNKELGVELRHTVHALALAAVVGIMATIYVAAGAPIAHADDGSIGNVDQLTTNLEEIQALKQIDDFTQQALTTGEIPCYL